MSTDAKKKKIKFVVSNRIVLSVVKDLGERTDSKNNSYKLCSLHTSKGEKSRYTNNERNSQFSIKKDILENE